MALGVIGNSAASIINGIEQPLADITGGNGIYKNTAFLGDAWNGLFDIFTLGAASRIQNRNELKNLETQAAAERAASAEAYQRELDAENTYYQRRVKDLKAAGLNPWLAVQNGLSGNTSVSAEKTNVVSGKQSAADGTKALASLLAATAGMMMSAAQIAKSASKGS